jgi:hypothetical protein
MSAPDPFADAVRTVFGYYVSPARVDELRERTGFRDMVAACELFTTGAHEARDALNAAGIA